MTAWTYAALTSAVVDEAEMDGDTTFQTQLPNLIDRAEWRLTRDLDSFGLVINMSATGSVATPWIPLPTGCLIIKSFMIQDAGYRTNLIMKTNEWLNEYWPDRVSVITSTPPKYFARFDNSTAIVAPAFASANELQMQFVVRPSALSVSEQTNFFTNFTPSALFFATMVETAYFMKDAQAAQLWEGRYQNEVDRIRNEGRRQRNDDNRQPQGNWGENTLMKDGG